MSMKMRDAFELHPELQSMITSIDASFAKPNVLCKTMWNKLKDINNSKLPLTSEKVIMDNVMVRKNKPGKVRTTTSCTWGADFDAAVEGKLSKKKNVNRYEIESIYANSYNSDVNVSLKLYCEVEEDTATYNRRQKLLKLKSLFAEFICDSMKEAERNAETIKREKESLKKAYEEEVKLLKQKYMQK